MCWRPVRDTPENGSKDLPQRNLVHSLFGGIARAVFGQQASFDFGLYAVFKHLTIAGATILGLSLFGQVTDASAGLADGSALAKGPATSAQDNYTFIIVIQLRLNIQHDMHAHIDTGSIPD